MKRKIKQPAKPRISQTDKEFETLLQRAAEISKKKAGRKAAERLAR
jgi:hypothetical protein